MKELEKTSCTYQEPNFIENIVYTIKNFHPIVRIEDRLFKWLKDRRIAKAKKYNLLFHAEQELKAAGYDLNEQEESPNKWIVENIFELLETFSSQGHSGFSAPYTIDMFNTLANYKPLIPIQGTDNEWLYHGKDQGDMYQNIRCGAIFKDSKEGNPYYLDAIVWRGEDKYDTFTGTVEEISSSQYIKLPFTPKTFYIDVIRHKIKDFDEYTIKDVTQLNAVFEYYNFKEPK